MEAMVNSPYQECCVVSLVDKKICHSALLSERKHSVKLRCLLVRLNFTNYFAAAAHLEPFGMLL